MTRSLLSKKSRIKLYYESKLQARCQIAGRDDKIAARRFVLKSLCCALISAAEWASA